MLLAGLLVFLAILDWTKILPFTWVIPMAFSLTRPEEVLVFLPEMFNGSLERTVWERLTKKEDCLEVRAQIKSLVLVSIE